MNLRYNKNLYFCTTNMEKPLILITNDDGIFAAGLRTLINAAAEIGETVVVAPEKAQSGMSHAVTIAEPVRINKIMNTNGHLEYSCTGTPADCVKIGLHKVLTKKPDIILSGINHGSNASVNIVYSGTMAAVIEGSMNHIPSVGFSLDDYSPSADFSFTIPYVKKIIKKVLEHKLPSGVCLNVNFPYIDPSLIKGIKVCRQAKAYWDECFEERIDPHNRNYYWLVGNFIYDDNDDDTDYKALQDNYISIVPIDCDFTSYKHLNEIKNIDFNV